MFIENIADYLQKLKKRDIKPEIFTVFEFPDDLTILEILNSIGYRLANLFGFVKINSTTKTVDTGEASVNVTGDVDNLNFDFTIPRGKDGAPGVAVTVGETTTGAAGTPANVTNSGTESHPVLNFTIPRGETGPAGPAGERGPAGDTGPAGKQGPAGERGPKGDPGVSVTVGTTTTGTAGTPASVTNSGTDSDPVLNFTIPRGEKGEKGDKGEGSATVTIGTTTTGAAGTQASVTNSGTDTAAILNFTIPQGEAGPAGERGPAGEQGPAGAPGPENLVIVTATASTTVQGEYIPDTTYTKALSDIQANKAIMIKLENVPGRYYIPYSSSNAEILASAGTVSGSNQSIELYLLKWTASNNTITITGTKKGCIADGGTAGQVLVKKSDESFDTEWKLQYKIVKYGQPFNKSDLIKLFNSGTLIYVYNETTYRLYTIYALAENILYGISGITFNATAHSVSSNRCQITDNNSISLLYESIYGVANGGTTGQILAKKSNTNGNTEWIDPPSGSTVSVNVGTTTTGEAGTAASVTNSGDETNVVLNFTIPRGETGPAGERGPAGDTGPAGPGVATGGTTGQVLAKKSDTNYDTEWVDNAGGEIPGTFSIPITETDGKITTTYNYQSVIDAVNNGKVPYLINTATGEFYMLLNYNANPTGTSRWLCPQYNFAGTAAKIVHFIIWSQNSATSKYLNKSTTFFQTIPTGGTTGQVLVKKSNDDFDVEWTTL